MSKIIIEDLDSLKFNLTKDEAKALELKLNVSSKGRPWIAIGDYLFKFHTGEKVDNTYVASTEQMEFLIKLNGKKSWEDCKGL